MSFRRVMRGHAREPLPADGYLDHDPIALSPYQHECIERFQLTMHLEQESYFLRHPEIHAMLQMFISTIVHPNKSLVQKRDIFKYFAKSAEELDKEIRELLNLPPNAPYNANVAKVWYYDDLKIYADFLNINQKHHPTYKLDVCTPEVPTPDTLSSSFVSIGTSASTIPTPEPIETPPLTLYETFYNMVSNALDKATFVGVTDDAIKYDTAYVELMNAVEVAMEIPVIGIREDIATLLCLSYNLFEKILDERDRLAAQIAWEKRMRKKLKRTLRRQKNFKGYETPPTPKSFISSHESYKIPPQPPCKCHPQFKYNRYPKDRFGIYLPLEKKYSIHNITVLNFPIEEGKQTVDDGNDNEDAESAKAGGTVKPSTPSKSGATSKSNRSGGTHKSDGTTKSNVTTVTKEVTISSVARPKSKLSN